MRIDHHRRAWARLRHYLAGRSLTAPMGRAARAARFARFARTAQEVDRPVRVAAAAVLSSLVLVVGAAGVTVLTAPGPGERPWVQYAGQEVPVRFLHPEDWQVESVTDTGDPDEAVDGEIEIFAGGSWGRVRAVANPQQLSPERWAVERGGAEPAEVVPGEVGDEPAALVERPGERRLYVVRDDEVYELTWRGATDGDFDEWLAGIEFGPTPSPDPSPEQPGPPDPPPAAEPGQESPTGPAPTDADPADPDSGDAGQTPGPPGEDQAGPAALTPEEFVALFYQAELPDLAPITEAPPLTGDPAADERIVELAEERGYRLQSEADGDLVPVDGELAHPLAVESWAELTAAAAEDGITLEVISGYRSVAAQRSIFLGRLDSAGPFTPAEIAAGDADEAIDEILATSSIPGYSKHHTGYALDVRDVPSGLPFTRFGETAAYEWMSADNFANATRFGFVPSYPDGVEQQGPMPEEWEFVYVGTATLP